MRERNFEFALQLLKQGKKLTRDGWNGWGLYIQLQTPDENSKMTRPYIYLVSPIGSTQQFGGEEKEHRVPWLPSQTDVLASDWTEVEDVKKEEVIRTELLFLEPHETIRGTAHFTSEVCPYKAPEQVKALMNHVEKRLGVITEVIANHMIGKTQLWFYTDNHKKLVEIEDLMITERIYSKR